MTLTRLTGSKNLPYLRHRGEAAIDAKADAVRARFATPSKHTIYDRKLREAERYLEAVADGTPPANLNRYPYLRREVGTTAPDAETLANLWVAMNAQWEEVAAAIEEITISAKAQVRAAGSGAAIDPLVASTVATLDAIGTPPPGPPDKPRDPFPHRAPSRPTRPD